MEQRLFAGLIFPSGGFDSRPRNQFEGLGTVVRKKRKKSKAKAKTYKGKSTRPGGGGNFAKLVDELKAKGYSDDRARRVAAAAGRKKYGAKQMARWSAKGRKRAAQKRKGK